MADVTAFGDARPRYICLRCGKREEEAMATKVDGQFCTTCQCAMAHSGYRHHAGGPAVDEYQCERCGTRREVPRKMSYSPHYSIGVDMAKPRSKDESVEVRTRMSDDGRYLHVEAVHRSGPPSPTPSEDASKRGVAFAKALREAAKKQQLGKAYAMGERKLREMQAEGEAAAHKLFGVPIKIVDEPGLMGGPYVIDEREWQKAAGIPLGPAPEKLISLAPASDTAIEQLRKQWERNIHEVFGVPKEILRGFEGTASFIDDPLGDEEKLAQESQRWLDPEEMDAAEGAGLSGHVRPFRYLVGAFGSPELLDAIDRYDDEWPLERAKEPRGRMTLTEWLRRQHLNEKPYGR